MIRRVPLLPTLLVALAAAAMVALGVWQLQRAAWKQALLARYEQAAQLADPVSWPRSPDAIQDALYRRSGLSCERVLGTRATAGRNDAGEPGWAQVARCALDGGGEADVVLGWSRAPQPVTWGGGDAKGFVTPAGGDGARLVADPPLARLVANARPDPADLPNNHLAYAGQWFFFAATAALIYALALRRKWQGGEG
jgi:surfeit locus 1 family protein